MDVPGNVRPRRAVVSILVGWMFGGAVAACDAEPSAPVDDTGGDANEAPEGGSSGDDGAAAADGGEPMGCEGPLGEGACADVTICDTFDCGGKTAPYNHFGCPRTSCTSDADCGGGERCFAVALETDCRAETGACADVDGTCTCEGATSCAGVTQAHCLPTEFYPASEDCGLAGLDCEQLTLRLGALDEAAAVYADIAGADLATQLAACRDRVVEASADCGGGVAP